LATSKDTDGKQDFEDSEAALKNNREEGNKLLRGEQGRGGVDLVSLPTRFIIRPCSLRQLTATKEAQKGARRSAK